MCGGRGWEGEGSAVEAVEGGRVMLGVMAAALEYRGTELWVRVGGGREEGSGREGAVRLEGAWQGGVCVCECVCVFV